MYKQYESKVDFVVIILEFILFPVAANNMNLVFSTFFSRSKFAGEITIFLNVIASCVWFIYFIQSDDRDSWISEANYEVDETIAHFLGLIP